jgi:HlyD family secretion protein
VVNYTVVVSVTNEEGLLLPGMTTTVDFMIERAQDVLKVPNAALRFRPTTEMMAEFRKQMEQQGGEGGRAWGQGRERGGGGEPGGGPREGGGAASRAGAAGAALAAGNGAAVPATRPACGPWTSRAN